MKTTSIFATCNENQRKFKAQFKDYPKLVRAHGRAIRLLKDGAPSLESVEEFKFWQQCSRACNKAYWQRGTLQHQSELDLFDKAMEDLAGLFKNVQRFHGLSA